MINWLKLTEAQRRITLEQAALNLGTQVKAVEKDWWVTLTLKALFAGKYAKHMIFKGGTSLSKGWKLIERFSEDIDIALAIEAFGMEHQENPSKTYVEKLKKKGCEFTSNQLKEELEAQPIALGVPKGMLVIEAAPVNPTSPDTDPQTLLVKYASLFDPDNYIDDPVKIEVSVRSMKEPFSKVTIQSLLTEHLPNPTAYPEQPFAVDAVEPQRTFLEKIFLLHEEFLRPNKTKIRAERMSRHLYDLEKLMDTPAGQKALADAALYNAIINHRESYSRLSWVDYATLSKDTVSFLPPPDLMDAYGKDYQTMTEVMIYGNRIGFKQLMERLNSLQNKLRNLK